MDHLVAVKVLQKSILKEMKTFQQGDDRRLTVLTAFDNIEREVATMKRLRHPNLIRLFEVIDSVESDRLLMVLEYVPMGTLLVEVTPAAPFSTPHARRCHPFRGDFESRRGHQPIRETRRPGRGEGVDEGRALR